MWWLCPIAVDYRYILLRGMEWKSHIYFVAITRWPSPRFTCGAFSAITTNMFVSYTITLFTLVPYLRCAHSYLSYNLPSWFNYRRSPHNVSTAYFAFFTSSYLPFSTVILMLRTYAFSGRKKVVLGILSVTFFGLVGITIWVIGKKLTRLSRTLHL